MRAPWLGRGRQLLLHAYGHAVKKQDVRLCILMANWFTWIRKSWIYRLHLHLHHVSKQSTTSSHPIEWGSPSCIWRFICFCFNRRRQFRPKLPGMDPADIEGFVALAPADWLLLQTAAGKASAESRAEHDPTHTHITLTGPSPAPVLGPSAAGPRKRCRKTFTGERTTKSKALQKETAIPGKRSVATQRTVGYDDHTVQHESSCSERHSAASGRNGGTRKHQKGERMSSIRSQFYSNRLTTLAAAHNCPARFVFREVAKEWWGLEAARRAVAAGAIAADAPTTSTSTSPAVLEASGASCAVDNPELRNPADPTTPVKLREPEPPSSVKSSCGKRKPRRGRSWLEAKFNKRRKEQDSETQHASVAENNALEGDGGGLSFTSLSPSAPTGFAKAITGVAAPRASDISESFATASTSAAVPNASEFLEADQGTDSGMESGAENLTLSSFL